MRIALVHEWLDTWAGSEQCLEKILRIFPDAELFALVDFLPPGLRTRVGERSVHTSFLQRIPGAARHFRQLLPLFPRAIESLDVASFDLVISNSHAVAKGVKHACAASCTSATATPRCATPGTCGTSTLPKSVSIGGFAAGRHARMLDRIAAWDRRTSDRVDDFVAISHHISDRIARCYAREATVIYPPVTLGPFDARPRKRDRYVTVSRLVPYKRIDVLAAAFAHLPGRELVDRRRGPRTGAHRSSRRLQCHARWPRERRATRRNPSRGARVPVRRRGGLRHRPARGPGGRRTRHRLCRGGVTETIRGLDDREPTGVFFDAQTPEAVADAVLRFEANADAVRRHDLPPQRRALSVRAVSARVRSARRSALRANSGRRDEREAKHTQAERAALRNDAADHRPVRSPSPPAWIAFRLYPPLGELGTVPSTMSSRSYSWASSRWCSSR